MFAREVGSIMGDDSMMKPDATKDVLPKEFHYLLFCDLRIWNHLYPLGEVVGAY